MPLTSLQTNLHRIADISWPNLFSATPNRVSISSAEYFALGALVVVAALLRLWGLGEWGLQYDEETMALPVRHIVEQGYPAMPSGMGYVRAVAQLYLMAGSVMLFGESEWVLRLPSVVCGLVLVVLAFFFGRRFLAPLWNIAFTTAVALLPALIVDSQEARMYIFLLTSLCAFQLLVFRWEQSQSNLALLGAVLVMAFALQFHALAIFASFALFFPGLLHRSWRLLLTGGIAFFIVMLLFVLIQGWVDSFYPSLPNAQGTDTLIERRVHLDIALANWWLLAFGIAIAGVAATLIMYNTSGARRWAPTMLVFLGVVAQLALFYHVAVLLLAGGLAVGRRFGTRSKAMLGVVVLAAALAVLHVLLLRASGYDWDRQLVGGLVGLPSIWPYIRFATYSPIAAAIVAFGSIAALWRFAQGGKIPDVWLYALLTIWLPLFLLGMFQWYVQLRYTQFALLPMLLCAFAAFSFARNGNDVTAGKKSVSPAGALIALVAVIAIVNPIALASVVNAGYSIHPDHKGAAEFMQAQQLAADDIVIAEDVLQQTYYLGRVDYWLIGRDTAEKFSIERDGRRVDIYTATPILDSGAALTAQLENRERGAIYIIGSGEQQSNGRAAARTFGIQEALHSDLLSIVHRGRDELTVVWKAPRPEEVDWTRKAAAAAAEQSTQQQSGAKR